MKGIKRIIITKKIEHFSKFFLSNSLILIMNMSVMRGLLFNILYNRMTFIKLVILYQDELV